MCGIAGIYSYSQDKKGSYPNVIRRMTDSMTHRGPDDGGLFESVEHGVFFGHRRLSIIDLNPRSNQPFKDHSGRYVLVFNGQVYNFEEIRAQIPEYPFSCDSDTEVIIAAYAKWGVHCLDRFKGMFALAIYDTLENTLFLARDRMGVKPFYYSENQDGFFFASEIRALLKSECVSADLSQTGLTQYLMFQSAQCPDTMITGIRQLRPGHYMLLQNGPSKEKSYWSFGHPTREVSGSRKEAVEEVRRLLFQSIEKRMISDVPLGAFLSGGIDSSAIVAIMAQIAPSVDTFSIVFAEDEFDESVYSDLIAKKYNTNHHKLKLTAEHFLSEVPNALNAMDSPSGDGMNTYVVSKLTRQAGITVALSGIGGDELFAGYNYFKIWRRLKHIGFFRLPEVLRSAIAHVSGAGKDRFKSQRLSMLAHSDGSIEETYPVFRQVFTPQTIREICTVSHRIENHSLATTLNGNFSDKLISQLSIAELTHYTLDVLLKDADQFSMASALEVRDPFFDHHLVEYVLSLPDKWKIGTAPKQLLVDACGDLLPKEIVMRTKRGFSFPWHRWLRGELRELADDNLNFLADHPDFNGDKILSMWRQFQKDAGMNWTQIWLLVSLSHWLRTNIPTR